MSAKVKAKGAYLLRFLFGVLLGLSISANAMTPMSDTQLSDVSGQALLFAQKTVADGTTANGGTGLGTAGNITFYRMGLDGTVNINTNINHLRLGCGGVNGTGACDISIDNMALSGGTGPGSDAVLTRPYVQLAILNDGSATNRQVVGFQFSASAATGTLTTGVNTGTQNGINELSGFMVAQSTSSCTSGPLTGLPCVTGTATTAEGWFGGHPCNLYAAPCDPMNGNQGTYLTLNTYIDSPIGGGHIGITLSTDPQGTPVNGSAGSGGIHLFPQSVPYTGGVAVVNGSRITSTSLNVGGTVPTIPLPFAALAGHPIYCKGDSIVGINPCGLLSANITAFSSTSNTAPPSGCGDPPTYPSCNPTGTSGSISGLSLGATFTEGLGYIHNISVSGTPFSLSFQKTAVMWPGSYSSTVTGIATGTSGTLTTSTVTNVAQPGWWMAFNAPVQLGSLAPAQPVDLSTAPGVYGQLADKMQYLFSAQGAMTPNSAEGQYFANNSGANTAWFFASNDQHYCGGTYHGNSTGNGVDCGGALIAQNSGGPGPLHLSGAQAWQAIASNPSYTYAILPNLVVTGSTGLITTTLSNVALSHATQDVPTNCWGAAVNTQPCFN